MIFIIGTDRYVQVSTTPKRDGAGKQDLIRFQRYLSVSAKHLGAKMIAEEASKEWVNDQGPDAWSIAKRVAEQMGIRHRFCDPDAGERRAAGLKSGGELWDKANAISMRSGRDIVAVWREEVRNSFPAREDFWLRRLKVRGFKKMTILFVCGAEHVDTFKTTLASNGVEASIYCRDWPGDISSDATGDGRDS
jgi:hypothetical protein